MNKGGHECWYGAVDHKSSVIKLVEWCFKEGTRWCEVITNMFSDEGLTPTKDEGTCLRRLSMFRKEVH